MPTKWYTWVALVLAVWFALTSWMWFWLFNLIFSYPFGLVALALWWLGRKQNATNKINRAVFWILMAGWISSILAILMFK